MSARPLLFCWQGDGFTPANVFVQKQADREFVVGEKYMLVEHHERSPESHRHFFASVNEAWKNLPEHLMRDYPTVEHLRKKMLIHCGFADERAIACASEQDAKEVAAFVEPMDDFAVIDVRDGVVRVFTAKSQSVKAMSKSEFQTSKQAVLDALDDLLGLERGTIAKHADKAA